MKKEMEFFLDLVRDTGKLPYFLGFLGFKMFYQSYRRGITELIAVGIIFQLLAFHVALSRTEYSYKELVELFDPEKEIK